ncbi:MAG: adenosylhomocysteinase, partial [Candidatus Thalassarchaeaceae archaeon]|nr:adenosylhomocysteinase [Candidatus Thalassarchaeaceae archaeon]
MDEGPGFKVADISLADEGSRRVDWARSRMPVLGRLRVDAEKDKPLKGMVVAGCLHVTKETAVLIETIEAAGAKVAWSGCNPLSTQDDVAAWLAAEGYSIYAWHGQSVEDFYWCIDQTIQANPTLTLDDGADLIVRVHG